MTSDVRISVLVAAAGLGAAIPVGDVRSAAADCPISLDTVYSYADEEGTTVALRGESPIHVEASLSSASEVYAGVGLSLREPKAPFDASGATGIAFKAKRGAGATPHVRFKVPDAATDPDGGQCTECYNDFGIPFQVGEEWTRFEVRFEDLKQEVGWGKPQPPAIDRARLFGLQWQSAVPGARLDLWIDDIVILGCTDPDGGSAPPVRAGAGDGGGGSDGDGGGGDGGGGRDGGGGGWRGASLGGDTDRPRGDSLLRPRDGGEETEGYRFSFHGFLRVPVRVGIGSGTGLGPGVDPGRKLHSPPQIPDGAYTDWRYTNVSGGPWTELWFSYGNGTVAANVVLAAYDISDASYRDLLSQLGINQSFISFDLPRAFGKRGGLSWNVGAFSNRYGTADRYDAGKYDTYLFGATHVAGETVSAFYRLTPELTLAADHGLGAKLQVTPQVAGLEAPYLPYPGDLQQGTTLLHHAHVGLGIGSHLTVALHMLTEWTDDARLTSEEDGRITNVGADVKLMESRYGDGYLGLSHIISDNPLRVAGAFEALHSFEGWNLRDNYFGEDATGTGTIDTLMFQYAFSRERFRRGAQDFWGQGPDLVASVFGMYNRVASDDPMFSAATAKLKLGGEVTWTPRSWLGGDLRYDLVQPDMSDDRQTFHVISPSLLLRSRFASNEQVVVGYSYYVNGDRVTPGYPHETLRPDRHLLRISASMWW
jgi:hypothetical protein